MIDATRLDALVDRARAELDAAEPEDGLERLRDFGGWYARQRLIVRHVRIVAWGATALWVYYFAQLVWHYGYPWSSLWLRVMAFALPLTVFVLAVRLAGRRGYLAQVCTRALLATTCMVGVSTAIFQNATFDGQLAIFVTPAVSQYVVPAALFMLGLLGGHGLRTHRPGVGRTGFENLLSLSLVLGLADAGFMAFVDVATFGVVELGPWPFVLPVVLCAGAWGLLRGRVWGLLLMASSNLAEVFLVFDGQLFGSSLVTGSAAFVLLLTASVQLLLPVPVYAAMLGRGAWVRRLQALDGSVARILAVVLGVLLGFSALVSMLRTPQLRAIFDALS